MKLRLICTAILTVSLTAAPAMAQNQCVTGPEAEAISLVAMPEVIRQVGRICAPALPASSLVRQTAGPFLAKYQAEADRAWPAARTALARVGGPQIEGLLQSDFTRPLLTSLLAPALVGNVEVQDCPAIDRIVTLLQPLPPRNTAGVLVSALQLIKEKQASGQVARSQFELPICPAGRR